MRENIEREMEIKGERKSDRSAEKGEIQTR